MRIIALPCLLTAGTLRRIRVYNEWAHVQRLGEHLKPGLAAEVVPNLVIVMVISDDDDAFRPRALRDGAQIRGGDPRIDERAHPKLRRPLRHSYRSSQESSHQPHQLFSEITVSLCMLASKASVQDF
jgi:hypothetical protein